jgi:hypothetical protein
LLGCGVLERSSSSDSKSSLYFSEENQEYKFKFLDGLRADGDVKTVGSDSERSDLPVKVRSTFDHVMLIFVMFFFILDYQTQLS